MKKTFNIIAKSVAMLLVAFNLNACLEKLPGDYILEEDAMKTFNDAEQTLTGIYSSFMSSALYSGYLHSALTSSPILSMPLTVTQTHWVIIGSGRYIQRIRRSRLSMPLSIR